MTRSQKVASLLLYSICPLTAPVRKSVHFSSRRLPSSFVGNGGVDKRPYAASEACPPPPGPPTPPPRSSYDTGICTKKQQALSCDFFSFFFLLLLVTGVVERCDKGETGEGEGRPFSAPLNNNNNNIATSSQPFLFSRLTIRRSTTTGDETKINAVREFREENARQMRK